MCVPWTDRYDSFLHVFLSLVPVCTLCLLFLFWKERIVVGRFCLLFQLALLKCPPSQVQLEKSIYLQYVITLSSLPLTLCADFIFVGCKTLLSGVQRNAERKDGYYARRKQYLLSRSCPSGPFSLGCQSKGTPCLA